MAGQTVLEKKKVLTEDQKGAVAVGLLFGVFCLSKKAELLGEQKGVSDGPCN